MGGGGARSRRRDGGPCSTSIHTSRISTSRRETGTVFRGGPSLPSLEPIVLVFPFLAGARLLPASVVE